MTRKKIMKQISHSLKRSFHCKNILVKNAFHNLLLIFTFEQKLIKAEFQGLLNSYKKHELPT